MLGEWRQGLLRTIILGLVLVFAGCVTEAISLVVCVDNGDCPRELPWCDRGGDACAVCRDDGDCSDRSFAPVCDPASGGCVGCVDNDDCGGETPACDPEVNHVIPVK